MEAEKKVESLLDGSVARTLSDPIVVEGKGQIETREFLEERFGSDASFGVRHIDIDTGKDISVDDLLSYEGDTESVFPDGSITDCANYAIQVRNAMPAGAVRVVGFRKEENPDSDVARESWKLLQLEGPSEHVFAIVDDRYLVDPWAKLFTGVRDRVAYDLQDDQDALLVAQTYGSPGNWSELPETGIWRERTSQWDRKGLEKVTAKIWSLIWPMYQNKSTKRVEYVVVNENLLGYRAPGAQTVQVLFAPGRDPRNTAYPVQLTMDAVRPATAADFAQYRVVVDGYVADLSKPLIPVLEHHLTENVPLDLLDSEAVARELRERTLEYAWATRKTPEALLRMADDLISKEQEEKGLKAYRVSLYEEPDDKFKILFKILFDCMAEDVEHAEKQATEAYPGCEIFLCEEIDDEQEDSLPNEAAAQDSQESEGDNMLLRNED
ncbi:MAG: hypothetical protein ACYCS8_09840 [Acidithiobacillus sp.]